MARLSRVLICAVAVGLAAPRSAAASVPHVVAPGESLWSLAAAQNMTTRAFAAANGLSEDAHVVLGSTLQIPSVAEASSSLGHSHAHGPTRGGASTAALAPTATGSTASAVAPPAQGGYTVRPGDTISGLAASSRIPVALFAQMNGLDPRRSLLAGTVVKLQMGAPLPARPGKPPPAVRVVSPAAPTAAPAVRVVSPAAPTAAPGRVAAADITDEAARHGVPGSLTAAIAWQESGFNNAAVSSANARGVMQVMPGTWDWVQRNLAGSRLDPNSPRDNVHAGVLYLGTILRSVGGDPALAAAGYYQGPASVARIGMLPETRRYVDNVLALRGRFGG